MVKKPIDRVRSWCREQGLAEELVMVIPTTYIRYGTTLVLRLPDSIPHSDQHLIARGWAHVLDCGTVLRRTGIMHGPYREPSMERLFGPGGDTIHKENGIRYCFDPERIMFSPGNLTERTHVGSLDLSGETVIDLFAGIGYFTLPAALHGKAKQMYACEINPVAFHYLKQNLQLNHAQNVTPLFGDNRDTAPCGVANRVIMGYVGATHRFLLTAFRCLQDRGIIHYHETCPVNQYPDATINRIKQAFHSDGVQGDIHGIRKVKSYGPKMVHVVADIAVQKG